MEQERSELHAEIDGSHTESENAIMFSCPYLGTMEDTETSLSFPAVANHCFRTKTPATVEFSHQVAYCLTDKHSGCHIFQLTTEPPPTFKRSEKVKTPEHRNRRASIYALPLVLILLFLAAILWWPAPGTSLEDAIAFGAQLRGDITESFSAGDEITPNELSGQLEDTMQAINDVDTQAEGNDQPANASNTLNTVTEALSNPESDAQESAVESSDSGESAAEPEVEQTVTEPEVEQPIVSEIETVSEETAIEPEAEQTTVSEDETVVKKSADDNQVESVVEETVLEETTESSFPDLSDAAGTSGVSTTSEDPFERQESSAQDTEMVLEFTAEDEELFSASEADIEEVEETPRLIIFDLPVISSELPTQNIAPDQPAATSPAGERLAQIGPTVSSSLSLRDADNNVRALFVRQNPSVESQLLTIINRRQQATLLGRDNSSTWFKVRLDTGIEGWVNAAESKAGVDPSSLPLVGELAAAAPAVPAPVPVSTITSFPVIRSAVVNAGALNLRSGPGVSYEPVTIINKGALVGLIGRRGLGVWVRVRLDNGLEGWVNSSLLAPLT